jgi:hypothetical protein
LRTIAPKPTPIAAHRPPARIGPTTISVTSEPSIPVGIVARGEAGQHDRGAQTHGDAAEHQAGDPVGDELRQHHPHAARLGDQRRRDRAVAALAEARDLDGRHRS